MVLIIILTELVSYIDKEVSVPLRGLWFLSLYFLYLIVKVQIRSFRPLTGIMVLIGNFRINVQEWQKVSVPLRGLWFLSWQKRRKNHEILLA